MLSSAVRTFSDPDDYGAAIRQANAQVLVTGRGHFTAQITRIDLHCLWMQRLSESLPRIIQTDMLGGRAVITFRTQSGPDLSWSGFGLQPGQIMRHPQIGSSFQHSSGAVGIGAMSLPLEDMASVGSAIAGCDLTPPRDVLIVAPGRAAMAKLQRLHAAAGDLAETTPEIIAQPEAARGLEQLLIEALIGCLAEAKVDEDTVAQRQHELIMRRFRRVVEANPTKALYIPEICAAVGVSARTLLVCCQEHLGMGPKQFLLLRRIRLARRALRRSAPGSTTVTEILTQHGFWNFGRFAVLYRSLYGERPSDTLGRIAH